MFAENERISVRQMQCIIMLNILSFGFFIFPSAFRGFSGLEIIISAVIGGIAELFVCKAVTYVCSGKIRGLNDVFDKYMERTMSFAVKVIFLFFLILKSSVIILMYSSSIKTNSLINTPLIALIATALAVSVYISMKGIETIGRISEFFIILVLAGILFVFVFAAKSGGFSNISPTGEIGVGGIAEHAAGSLYFFQGMEIIFVLYMFLSERSSVKQKDILRSFELVWLIMTFSAFLIFTKLKVIEEDFSVWPFIKVADNIEIPFAFIERQDFIIIGLETVFMVFQTSLSTFASAVILSDITKKFTEIKMFSYFILAGIIIVLIIKAVFGVYALLGLENILSVFCFAVLPLILAGLKKGKAGEYEK